MITVILSLVTSMAFAAEGTYQFSGQYNVVSSIRYETVYTPSESGKTRLAELQSDGYACQAKLQFVQCKKIFPSLPILPESLSDLMPSAQNVTFGAVQSQELLSQGDDVSIYEVAQTIDVDGVMYDKAKYLESADISKITVGDPNDSMNYHSFIVYSNALAVFESVSKTESKWAFSTYLVEFYLIKK